MMSIYPLLSPSQQENLPELIQAKALPTMFDDSTHQLWHCDTADGEMMLKVCNSDNVKSSSFWQGMFTLFDVDLPKQLAEFSQVYQKITELSPLVVPEYIASASEPDKQIPFILSQSKDGGVSHGSTLRQAQGSPRTAEMTSSPRTGNQTKIESSPAFILTRIVSGTMIDNRIVTDSVVTNLAKHISQLHQNQQTTWGQLTAGNLTATDWSQRLQNTLSLLAKKQTIPAKLLDEALTQAATIKAEKFVPSMLDLRWDQFLQHNDNLALVDLDAFVFAPKELELVLLEYLLDQQQAALFIQHYQQTHTMPDLTEVRTAYRLLLFLMNVLGEQDIDVWMQVPARF